MRSKKAVFFLLVSVALVTLSQAFLIRQHAEPKHFVTKSQLSDPVKYPDSSYLFASTGTKDADAEGEESDFDTSGRTLGLLVLLTVPLSWGTYVPVVRYLYEIQPPVPGFVFSAAYYTVAAFTTLSLVARQKTENSSNLDHVTSTDQQSGFSQMPIKAGLELGSYLFVANCLQVIGLQTVASDRAGFLVQLTTVMVPFAEALFSGSLLAIPLQTWFACFLAFIGLFVMGLDGKEALISDPVSALFAALSSFTRGDLLIVSAAVLYTLHVVRLGVYARKTTPMKLAAMKATIEAILSSFLVGSLSVLATSSIAASSGLLGFAVESGKEILSFFSAFTTGIASGAVPKSALFSALGATLWTGWVTCAYTIYAQSFGQSRVSPTTANLIYTFQPIFTAFFAWALLGETMGPIGFLGGGLIGLSVYTVASVNSFESKRKKGEGGTGEDAVHARSFSEEVKNILDDESLRR